MSQHLRILYDPPPTSPEFPTVRALEQLWEEVSQKRLWAPPNFWKYVRLSLRMRLKLINPADVPVVAHRGKVNDCEQCTENCCVGPKSTVLLRLRDIATLVDLGREDLIGQNKPRFTPDELAKRPALRANVASQGWQTFPVLKQTSYGACQALTDEGRCSLYPHWPLSCARFPYSLHADDLEVFYSPRCDSFWIRPDAEPDAHRMGHAAVAAYNERIKDELLLAYAPERVESLGLVRFLNVKSSI